jgi:hypothetical protein
MRDDFSEQQWISYMDAGAKPAAMQRHVGDCADCRTFLSSLADVSAILDQHAGKLRRAASLSDHEVDVLLEKCMVRLRGESPRSKWTAGEAVLLLRALVEPICGAGMAGKSIHLAVRRSTSGSITDRNWDLFVSNLSDVMVSVCGSAAGRLVNRAGFCLALWEG